MNDAIATLSLFCASLEKDVQFQKLSETAIQKVTKYRDECAFFTEYARLVIYAVLGNEAAEEIWGNRTYPAGGGLHALHELYWISTVLNPELSWSLRNPSTQKPQTREQEERKSPSIKKTLWERLPQIEKFLKDNVMGQEKAIETVLDVLYRTAAGLSDPDRPQAVLMFTGPSGSGKTHLAKTLAVALFDNEPTPDKISSPPAFFRV